MMKYRRVLLLFAVCILCGTVFVSRARAQQNSQAFDAGMSLEQTVAWLGRQLTHVANVVATDAKYNRRVETRLVKAKGCTLSYAIASETDLGLGAETAISQVREVWTLDLAGLDPATVSVVGTTGVEKRVWFRAAPGSRNAIRTSVFRNDRLSSTHSNRAFGYFSVRDEKMLAQAAAGLSHAVQLCRQLKQ